jgi:CcmD family protein
MPANTEYVVAAYCIVSSVIAIYGIVILLKLKSVNKRLKQIQTD